MADNIMLKYLLAATVYLAPIAAEAAAEGSWPDQFRGATFARPAWVLVIPAQRQSDGSLTVFDRTNPWVREWIVPKPTAQGIKTVTLTGDSEDKRLLTPADIEEMRAQALQRLAQKYNAPAIAVVVSDVDGTAAIAAWMQNRRATWEKPTQGVDRLALSATLDSIFTGTDHASSAEPDLVTDGRPVARIVAERLNQEENKMEYRIEPLSKDAEQLIAGSSSLQYIGQSAGDGGIMEVRIMDGSSIEAVLAAVGVSVQ